MDHLTNERPAAVMNNYEAVKRHQEKLAEFKIRPYKDEAQRIRETAEKLGMSVQGLFLEAVREYMANHPTE